MKFPSSRGVIEKKGGRSLPWLQMSQSCFDFPGAFSVETLRNMLRFLAHFGQCTSIHRFGRGQRGAQHVCLRVFAVVEPQSAASITFAGAKEALEPFWSPERVDPLEQMNHARCLEHASAMDQGVFPAHCNREVTAC